MKRLFLAVGLIFLANTIYAVVDENDYWTEDTATTTIIRNTFGWVDFSTYAYSVKCLTAFDLAKATAAAGNQTFTIRSQSIMDADIVAISTSMAALSIPTNIRTMVSDKNALLELGLKVIDRYHTLLDAESDLGVSLTARKAQCIQAFSIIRKRYLLLP